ncbi:MAG: hypothetical protein JWM27_3160 [Gemmatimonadetes bacterium]|nr:hypothetical protein [Gemmatimonadota bacterium]
MTTHRHEGLRRRAPAALLLAAGLLAAGACRSPRAEQVGAGEVDTVPRPQAAGPPARVLPGIDVLLRDSLALLRGRRVGLVTNQTAVTADGLSDADVLFATPGVRLVALYGPEHGIRGTAEGGATVANGRDTKTGLPIFSLYGRTQKPTPEMLAGVDVLVFDIQDIGARPYTFVWTMALAMEAAAAQRIPFVVLDRPNPITDLADGPLMQREIRDQHVGQAITGLYPVPLRHGMTSGEVARYVNGEFHVGADLHVVPAAGWTGDRWFDATGLRWIPPSPNIRTPDAALKYSGIVLAEATNLSVGRGTDAPFTYLGAPWMDAPAVLRRVAAYRLAGVRLDTVRVTPAAGADYGGRSMRAIRITITDRDAFRPPYAALVLLTEIRRASPDSFKIGDPPGFTQMLGSRWAYDAFLRGTDPREIDRRWQQELRAWMPVRAKYRIYPHAAAR